MNLELFFDYACPYCYKGHKNLLELLLEYPQLEITWRPCEAHPKPEQAAIHSEQAIQGMYYIMDMGGDLWNYHELVFQAMFDHKKDISDLNVLSACAIKCGVKELDFKQAIIANKYLQKVLNGNQYAWGEKKLTAVPSYISGNKKIASYNGVLVTKEELRTFISVLFL